MHISTATGGSKASTGRSKPHLGSTLRTPPLLPQPRALFANATRRVCERYEHYDHHRKGTACSHAAGRRIQSSKSEIRSKSAIKRHVM